MTTTVPEPWASALVRAQFTDPRYADDRPSLSQLAEAARLHPTTVSKMIRGVGRAKVENVAAVADALGVDVVEVSGWVKQARSRAKPYSVPTEVDLLTEREQDALSELIRAIAAGRREDGGEHARSAPNTQPSPAGDAGQQDGEVLPFKYPPEHEWTDDVQHNLDEQAKAARRGEADLPPDTTTGEESQVPPEDEDPA